MSERGASKPVTAEELIAALESDPAALSGLSVLYDCARRTEDPVEAYRLAVVTSAKAMLLQLQRVDRSQH